MQILLQLYRDAVSFYSLDRLIVFDTNLCEHLYSSLFSKEATQWAISVEGGEKKCLRVPREDDLM